MVKVTAVGKARKAFIDSFGFSAGVVCLQLGGEGGRRASFLRPRFPAVRKVQGRVARLAMPRGRFKEEWQDWPCREEGGTRKSGKTGHAARQVQGRVARLAMP